MSGSLCANHRPCGASKPPQLREDLGHGLVSWLLFNNPGTVWKMGPGI